MGILQSKAILNALELDLLRAFDRSEQCYRSGEGTLRETPGLVGNLGALGSGRVGVAAKNVRLMTGKVEADLLVSDLDAAQIGWVDKEAIEGFGHASIF